MTLRNIFMYVYNLLWRHNCDYLYSEERTTRDFLRMATNKPPCVINLMNIVKSQSWTFSLLHLGFGPKKLGCNHSIINIWSVTVHLGSYWHRCNWMIFNIFWEISVDTRSRASKNWRQLSCFPSHFKRNMHIEHPCTGFIRECPND